MRLSVRILAIVSMLLSATALGLFFWTGLARLPDTDGRGYLFLLAGGIGFLVTLGTFVVGLIATAQRRQFAWLIGLIAAWLASVVCPFIAGYMAQLLVVSPDAIPACQVANPTAPECQTSGIQLFLQNSPTWLFLAGHFLVGLVALLYSFRMREALVPTPAPRP